MGDVGYLCWCDVESVEDILCVFPFVFGKVWFVNIYREVWVKLFILQCEMAVAG
jgi:hypothetical protein